MTTTPTPELMKPPNIIDIQNRKSGWRGETLIIENYHINNIRINDISSHRHTGHEIEAGVEKP